MKKIFVILSLLTIFSCASQSIKPEVVRSKLARGMSVADVIASLGLPNQRQPETSSPVQLAYSGYLLNFTDEKLDTVQTISDSKSQAVELKSIQEVRPDYKADDVALGKNTDLEVSPFLVAGYLNDEAFFLKAVAAGVNRDGYTTESNALCVAMSKGFVKGVEAVVNEGYNLNVKLRTDRGAYITPESCLSFQKDLTVSEQIKKIINSKHEADAKEEANSNNGTDAKNTTDASKSAQAENNSDGKKKKAAFDIDWQAVKDFLKPNVPPRPSGNPKDREMQPESVDMNKPEEKSN